MIGISQNTPPHYVLCTFCHMSFVFDLGHKFNRVRPMNQTAKNTEIASDIQECNDVVTT